MGVIAAGLGSDDFLVRQSAAATCHYLGAAAPISRLQQALGDTMSDTRETAQATLAQIARWALEEALPESLAILHGEPPRAILGSLAQVKVARRLGAAGVAAAEVFETRTDLLEWPYSHAMRNELCTRSERAREDASWIRAGQCVPEKRIQDSFNSVKRSPHTPHGGGVCRVRVLAGSPERGTPHNKKPEADCSLIGSTP